MAEKQLIKPLPNELRSIVRSGITITSVSQCVGELVYNAIDAGATTILVEVNIDQFNVRVEDNGHGMNEVDLQVAGERYTTSKIESLEDFSKSKYYGFRGETLASIIDVSSTVDILTRPKGTAGLELKKKFQDGHPIGFVEKYNTKQTKCGTVISIGRLLSKLPVRRKRIDPSLQLEEVKTCLEKIALINPDLSIELRNEKLGSQLLVYNTSDSYAEAFNKVFRSRLGFDVEFTNEYHLHNRLFFNLSVSKTLLKTKHYQFVYVNKRFINRCRIHKNLGRYFQDIFDTSKDEKYPALILIITCPLDMYDTRLEANKHRVEFKDWDEVLKGLDGLLLKLQMTTGNSGLAGNKIPTRTESKGSASRITSYNVKGALHSNTAVRNSKPEMPKSRDSASGGSSSSNTSAKIIGISTSSSRSNRNLTRTGQSSRIVDTRAIRKRKLEKSNKEPVLNKPLLTGRVFEGISEDWKSELKNQPNQVGPSDAKRAKPQQAIPVQREGSGSEPVASTSSVQPTVAGENVMFAGQSPSVNSVVRWKVNKLLDSMSQAEDLPDDDIDMTSLGESSSGSTRYNRNKNPNVVLERDEDYVQKFNAEKFETPCCRERILNTIFQCWKETFAKNPKKVPRMPSANRDNMRPIKSVVVEAPVPEVFRFLDSPTSTPPEINTFANFLTQPPPNNAFDDSIFPSTNPARQYLTDAPKAAINSMPSSTIEGPKLGGDNVFKVPIAKPLNRLPLQKSSSMEWSDNMLSTTYDGSDPELFPTESNWSVDIVVDALQQEWLKTVDTQGRTLYVNLTNGNSSYDMIHVLETYKVTADEMKRRDPTKYSWLRQQIPRGFQQFLNKGEREIQKQGDMSKISSSIINQSVFDCLLTQESSIQSKWNKDELQKVSKYLQDDNNQSFQSSSKSSNFAAIQCWKTTSAGMTSFRFSREDLQLFHIIGQLDKKFILAGIRKSRYESMTLVIFDQHAVHERIRLEEFMLDSYVNPKAPTKYLKTIEVIPPCTVALSESDIRLMTNHVEIFCQAGIKFQPSTATSISVLAAPICFHEKVKAEGASRETSMRNLIQNLIQDVMQHIMTTKGAKLVVLPKTVHEVLCSVACHGAIKFGDKLDNDKCRTLITLLSKCNSLFQCAHGRPTVAPLMTAEDVGKASSDFIYDRVAPSEGENSGDVHYERSAYFSDSTYTDFASFNTSEYFSNAQTAGPSGTINEVGGLNSTLYARSSNVSNESSENRDSFFSDPVFNKIDNNNDEISPFFK